MKRGEGARKREEIKRKGKMLEERGDPAVCGRVPPDSAALSTAAQLPPWATRKSRGQHRAGSCVWPRPLLLTPRSRSLSPLFSLLGARPLRRALSRPSAPQCRPPTSGEQETRGLAEGRQVGEAEQGEEVTLDSSAQVHLTAAAGTSDAP